MFLELGLPFILRYIDELRTGKKHLKESFSRHQGEKKGSANETVDIEKKFLDKVERELALPDYSLFSQSSSHSSWCKD